MSIQIVLVDDHDSVRRSLRAFLRTVPDMLLVGEAANGTDAIKIVAEKQPDVVLMDLMMPRMDGVEATREIRARFPNIRVLVLTSVLDTQVVQAALDAGADEALPKAVTIDVIADAIRRLAALRHA